MVKWMMMREEKEGKKNGKYKRYSRCKMYGQTPCQNGEVKVYRYTGIQTATYRAKWTHSAN